MTAYYNHLSRVQNHPRNINKDIVSITGLFDVHGKLTHLNYYAKLVNDVEALEFIAMQPKQDIKFPGY